MIKKITIIVSVVLLCVTLGSTVCFAASYKSEFPSYVPVSGGAWCEIETSQGVACFVVANNYRFDVFGFSGVEGYNIANITSSTVNGNIYFENQTTYYGNPTTLQCRFTSFGTLSVYVPYANNYAGTTYQWQDLAVTNVLNTNIAFQDAAGNRFNNQHLYSTEEKMLMALLVVCVGILLIYPLRRGWHA